MADELTLTQVAELDVSSASGLCVLGDELLVVADDQNFLARYGFDGSPRARVPLLPGSLPAEHAARKRAKPDFEALTSLPDGRLLALGSGSTPARMRAALIDPRAEFSSRIIDLAPLYTALERELPELNIEGTAVLADRLVLLQRGNGAARANAMIDLDLHAALEAIDRTSTLDPSALHAVTRVQLGTLDGVPLSFTDATPHPDGSLLFSAAAEDTANTYDDGAVTGSIIGTLSPTGEVLRTTRLRFPVPVKIEGIACIPSARGALDLWLVSDADDPHRLAGLFRTELATP